MTSKPQLRFYLPQLDGLRFFAFLLVFIHHSSPLEGLFAPGSLLASTLRFLKNFGWCGVDLFLVLSAFLITTLLLMEHLERGRISLRDFYIRRMLRIWPLYYWVITVGFFVLPALGLFAPAFGSEVHRQMISTFAPGYFTFFGNYAVAAHGFPAVRTLAHLWTIALEEQFYVVWPALLILLLRLKRTTLIWVVLAALLCLTLALRAYLIPRTMHPAIWANTLSRLDPLVLGVALGFRRFGSPAQNRWPVICLKLLIGSGLVALIGQFPNIQLQSRYVSWQYLATAAGFTLILDASLSAQANPLAWCLSRRPFVWLGKRTYGLYVYHLLGVQFGYWIVDIVQRDLDIRSAIAALALRIVISLSLTVGLAALSYRYFESYFLRLKDRFSHVRSQSVEAPLGGG